MAVLLSNASATGNAVQWDGGTGLFSVVATFGGGSVTLQYLGPDGSTWLTAATALTANGVAQVRLPPGRVRAAVATATGVYANFDQMRD